MRHRNGERIKYLPYRPGLTVLDCRCGQGVLLDQLEGWAGAAWGIDRSLAALSSNPSIGSGRSLQPERVAAGAVGSLPFADGMFDAVFCEHILRQAVDPQQALREVARVLRHGGRLILWESRRLVCGSDGIVFKRASAEAGLTPVCQESFDLLAYPLAILANGIPLVRRSSPVRRVVQVLFALDVLLARLPAFRSRSWHLILVLERRHVRSSNA